MNDSVNETQIWRRTIRPEIGDLSPTAARELLQLRLSDSDAKRVEELSAKAKNGSLTGQESIELETYMNVGRALEFIKFKARLSLKTP